MVSIHVRLSDCEISAQDNEGGVFRGFIYDHFTKTSRDITFTYLQMAAILALGVGGEGFNQAIIDELYKIAEPAVAKLPNEFRPIP